MKEKLSDGIKAYRDNNKPLARSIFFEITKSNPTDEQAWLWLAATSEDTTEKIKCLKKALAINPYNSEIQLVLDKLEKNTPLGVVEQPKTKSKFPIWVLLVIIPSLVFLIFILFVPIKISIGQNQNPVTSIASIVENAPIIQNTKVVFPTLIFTPTPFPTYRPLPTYTVQPASQLIYIIITSAPQQPIVQQPYQVTCPSSYDTQIHNYNLQSIQMYYQNEMDSYNSQLRWAMLEGDGLLFAQIKESMNNATNAYNRDIDLENSWYSSLCP